MGLTVCEVDDDYPNLMYDVRTSTQGTLFLINACFYLVVELTFLVMTVRLFRKNTNLIHNFYGLTFYCAFHLALIFSMLYFLGGVICCRLILYYVFSNLPYLLQGIGVLVLIMQISNSHYLIIEIDSLLHNWCALFFALLYGSCFFLLLIFELINSQLHYFYMYNICCNILLILALFRQSMHLYDELAFRYPIMLRILRRRARPGIMNAIAVLMFSRSIFALCNVMGIIDFLRHNYQEVFAIYIMVFFIVFELVPYSTFILCIYSQLDQSNDKILLSTDGISAKILSHTGEKKFLFTPTHSLSLTKEMFDDEGMEED